jgi:hypothetical protein
MSCAEHYFENLLFDGQDIKGNLNKNELSEETEEAVRTCACYVIYTLFEGEEDFRNYLKEKYPEWTERKGW